MAMPATIKAFVSELKPRAGAPPAVALCAEADVGSPSEAADPLETDEAEASVRASSDSTDADDAPALTDEVSSPGHCASGEVSLAELIFIPAPQPGQVCWSSEVCVPHLSQVIITYPLLIAVLTAFRLIMFMSARACRVV
jgi:hypothetical protein